MLRLQRLCFHIISSCLLFVSIHVGAQPIRVQNLRCELLMDPIAVGTRTPKLSWEIVSDKRGTIQQAYEIIASSDKNKLDANEADLWSSGKIQSDATSFIKYAGKA